MKHLGLPLKLLLVLLGSSSALYLSINQSNRAVEQQEVRSIQPTPTSPTKDIQKITESLPKIADPSPSPLYSDDEILDSLPTLEPLAIPTILPTPTPKNTGVRYTPTPLPVLEGLGSLQQRQNPSRNDNQYAPSNVGFLTKNSRSSSPEAAQPEPTANPDGTLPLLSGQARGYAMLYLMHPKARPVVEAEIDTLIKANVQEVYIGVLVDGTFTKDHAYLQSVLKKLNDAGRIITLEQYLVSGPTMRKYETTPIQTPFSHLEPALFRSFYLYEPDIDQEIRKVAKEARATFEYNTQLNKGNTNFVAVMLEDNLDSPSYRYMRNIVSQEIGNTANFIRNACPDCYSGNDQDTFGDPLELHPQELFPELSEKDGYTLDGVDVMYPFDEKVYETTAEDVRSMLSEAATKKLSFFGLWKRGRQGIGPQGQSIHPDNRTYIVPTEEEKKLEIELLREGLSPAAE